MYCFYNPDETECYFRSHQPGYDEYDNDLAKLKRIESFINGL